ncbi:MEDS domain-containing protein [Haloplanus aerogenes]|uniref:histidine kinase n=1 Tax=Haloplanus aerogenes TaxID=660522 RepID=A0A3M0DU17_9EURY|nr:MEDS domain-containing protein [Haloplanus aerogenes]RMB25554.1 DcmR-like sensory protein [Haloplanus aerogenes]
MNPDYPSDEREQSGSETIQTVDTLRGELERNDLARHLALFYRSPQNQLEVAATFVKQGLRSGNRCLYFVDTNTRSTIERAFRRVDIDVERRVADGDLLIENAQDAYREANFDPDELISLLADACHGSVTDEYDGLWVAGELSWCFHTNLSYDHVIGFEADFDAACPDLPVTALCQYDLNQFNDESVAKALWTHEQIVYRYRLCENPYYIAPDEYRSDGSGLLNGQLMLEQMYDLAHARSQVTRREQRLSVVNRILRHDIRNDLNVVRGILNLFAERTDLDDTSEDRLDTAIRHVDGIFDVADKARYVERTISRSTVERGTLAPFIERALDRVTTTHPDATVSVEGIHDVEVVTDANLGVALAELLEYAIDAQDADEPRVELTVSDRPPERVQIEVQYPGQPIPRTDQQVLNEGIETPLNHCRGLGLWLAKWVVENAHGTLDFPETDEPRIRIELYRCLA